MYEIQLDVLLLLRVGKTRPLRKTVGFDAAAIHDVLRVEFVEDRKPVSDSIGLAMDYGVYTKIRQPLARSNTAIKREMQALLRAL